MDPIEGVIYDKDGQRTFTTNVDLLTFEMSDKLLINSYRNTVYQKSLFLEVEKFKKNNVEIEVSGFEFEPELIDNSLNSMQVEIMNRFDKEFYEELENKIIEEDLEFLKNRPKNIT